jgi:hypothetical protein
MEHREFIVLSPNDDSFQLKHMKQQKVKNMKKHYAFLPVIGLMLTLCVNSARAGDPNAFPAYYDGGIVSLTLNTHANILNPNAQGNSQLTIANKLAIPLYLVVGQNIDHVISSAPGEDGYSPIWKVYLVTENDDSLGHMSKDPLRSVADIMIAAAAGEVSVSDGPVAVVLCPAVSP